MVLSVEIGRHGTEERRPSLCLALLVRGEAHYELIYMAHDATERVLGRGSARRSASPAAFLWSVTRSVVVSILCTWSDPYARGHVRTQHFSHLSSGHRAFAELGHEDVIRCSGV